MYAKYIFYRTNRNSHIRNSKNEIVTFVFVTFVTILLFGEKVSRVGIGYT